MSQKTFTLPLGGLPVGGARFLARPNRFLVDCLHDTHGPIRAFLPNPGRLSELFFFGVRLHVLDHAADMGGRATRYTVLAVERDKRPVMLHTHWCNDMAELLLRERAVPGLEKSRILRREVKAGRSRFDFLLEDGAGTIYLEVKSCTLFGNGVAMFPDAITERGRRHLLELADIAGTGVRCAVLFIVQTDSAHYFMPDYHTDLAFARTMLAVHDKVHFLALPVSWQSDLTYRPGKKPLTIPWAYVEREARDGGAYLAIFHLNRAANISIGSLGATALKAGFYIYTGSAMRALDARMARHRRRRKRMHWHVDYLRAAADVVDIVPIRSSERLECLVAQSFHTRLKDHVPGFGCSDCTCASHLFYAEDNPLDSPAFHDWLQGLRMRPPT